MKIAFLHGWGGDRRLWDRLIPHLAEFDCHADDRGYFGDPAAIAAAIRAFVQGLG